LAVIGDRSEAVLAHSAIPQALALSGAGVEWQWLGTEEVTLQRLESVDGIWLVPGSPYRSLEGALLACRWARENWVAFLGTCGGFQHALLEFAQNVAGIADAAHGETDPDSATQVIALMQCGLVEREARVRFQTGSRLRLLMGVDESLEGYHCRYGLNPDHRAGLEAAGFRFSAFDAAGEVRGGELPDHPFFVGTLFQPERHALRGVVHPVIRGFLDAVRNRAAG
jgi:CTP synthase (UTP-ammonia lyase)